MRCSNCGAENPPRAQFCASCGNTIAVELGTARSTVYCTSCGQENSGDARFCLNCGTALQLPSGRSDPDAISRASAPPEYIGFWSRFGAQLVDGIIYGVGGLILAMISASIPFLGILFIPLYLYIFYKAMKSQTLGRKLLGMRVVDQYGEPIGFWRGVLRELIGKFVSAIVFYIGFVVIAFDSRKQGWHDKIASTYVISTRPHSAPAMAEHARGNQPRGGTIRDLDRF